LPGTRESGYLLVEQEAPMIERLYVDNFRTLVNFEWKPARLALLLGDNGTGKSSVIDALWSLRSFISGTEWLHGLFPTESRTRWESRLEQRFELDVTVSGVLFSVQPRYRTS
jgi:predicted ATPase